MPELWLPTTDVHRQQLERVTEAPSECIERGI